MTVVVDDQTLSAMLRDEFAPPDGRVFTTGSWYLRLCQAVARGTGGALSRPVLTLPAHRRDAVLRAVLELPERIELLTWKTVAPLMATQLDGPGRGLNLLSREALAVATIVGGRVVMAVGNENRALRLALDQVCLG